MANWCYNTLRFEAEAGVMEALRLFFIEMSVKEVAHDLGQLPEGYPDKSGFLFDIEIDEDSLCYLTRWVPNTEVMVFVADQFGAGFSHSYEELAMGIFGEAVYSKGVLVDIYLEPSDFSQYQYLEESDNYLFEGEYYNSDWEILDILLERKKQQIFKP